MPEFAARLADIPPFSLKEVSVRGRTVLLCRTRDEIFASEPGCTHAEMALVGGWLRGTVVTCPHHGARFDLRTGEVLVGPADTDLETYPVTMEDGNVYVDLP
jgi:nitrite reductase/ring-hydroxylating ferredoxin subunit